MLSLDERGIGHGPAVFSVFAATVVATRLLAGGLPDRIGAARCAVGAALIETVGLVLLGAASDLAVVIAGAIGMGAAFSLLFPSLSLVAVNRVGPERRGKAMGTFTAAFDLGHAGRLALGRRGCRDRRIQRRVLHCGGRGSRLRRPLRRLHRIGTAAAPRCCEPEPIRELGRLGPNPRYAAASRGPEGDTDLGRRVEPSTAS